MNIFEFKTKEHHEFIDLEAVQMISGLKYTEEEYKANRGYGPGSGGIEHAYSEGSFSLTLALRKERVVFQHSGERQKRVCALEESVAKELKLAEPTYSEHAFGNEPAGTVHYYIKRHSPEMQKYADYLNAMPDPFNAGRAFKAEYERLMDAWRKCSSRKCTAEAAAA